MKTLYIDIESAPNTAHVWGLFRQTVSLAQLRESARMLCFAAKWKGEKKIFYFSEFHNGREEMLKAAHKLLSEADVVVHYNGKSYDIPHLNREFVVAGMAPPAPFLQLDLLSVVRKRFRFASTKLQYVSGALKLGGKSSHEGHMLWVKCMAGDPTAWRTMARYNKQDVVLLESLHEKLLPWLISAPNARLVDSEADESTCPTCASTDLRKEGHAYTQLGVYQRYQCRSCGAWSRSSRRVSGTQVRGMQ